MHYESAAGMNGMKDVFGNFFKEFMFYSMPSTQYYILMISSEFF